MQVRLVQLAFRLSDLNLLKNKMTTALITALALSIGFGYFGWLIKKQIWNGAKSPSAPLEYGRKFAGYVVVVASLSGANFFIKDEIGEALIKFVIILIAFPSIGFAVGCLFGFIKNHAGAPSVSSNDSAQEQSAPPVKFESIKINPLILASMVAGLVVLAILYVFVNTNPTASKSQALEKSKWVPYSNVVALGYLNTDVSGKFNYFDEASIAQSGRYTYGMIGFDTESERSDGTNFVKQKIEAECGIPRFRIIEYYSYSKGVDEGFGNLLKEDKNFQKTIAERMLMDDKNYIHNGWTTRESSYELIRKYESRPGAERMLERMVASAKRDLAILDWLCN